jgi:hypothetical protein|tara:strand:- start:277 stop:507 length:231 start_codon:yes stop_codon:yes gene_type:complete
MKTDDDKFWSPHPKVGELVRCGDWTKFPGRVGQVLRVEMREGTYEAFGHINAMLCKVLVDGQIRDFLGWDVTVISD